MEPPALPHLRGALEIPFAVGTETGAHLGERALVAQRAENIMRHARVGSGVVHVVGHHPPHADVARDAHELRNHGVLLGEAVVPALDGHAAIEDVAERRGRVARGGRLATRYERRHAATHAAGEREEATRVPGHEFQRHARFATRVVHPRARHEGGDVAVSLTVHGEEHEVRTCVACNSSRASGVRSVRNGDLRADDRADLLLVRRLREGHHSAQLIVIGQCQSALPERGRALHEILGERRAVEKGVRGMTVQLHVLRIRGARGTAVLRGAQSYHPCRYHRSAPTRSTKRRSSPLSLSQSQ